MDKSCALFGMPPTGLVDVPADAIQLSPLHPGGDGLEDLPDASQDEFVVLAPPGTLERRFTLSHALRALKPQGELIALAPNNKGGTRLAKELAGFGCEVTTVSRSHHRICTALRPTELSGISEAIERGNLHFSEEIGLWTQPGVFSWDRPDPGSALLTAHLPLLSGRGADLGCGLGVLARKALGSDRVTELSLVDLDRRAIQAAERNVQDERAKFVWGDARTTELIDGLDFVIMNPPFHSGGVENHQLGQQFIARASSLLRKGGRCFLVANRHLPYEAAIKSAFAEFKVLSEQSGYKVIEAIK